MWRYSPVQLRMQTCIHLNSSHPIACQYQCMQACWNVAEISCASNSMLQGGVWACRHVNRLKHEVN